MFAIGALRVAIFFFPGSWTDQANHGLKNIDKMLLLVTDAVQTCTVPVYLAEIGGAELRGYLISAWIA